MKQKLADLRQELEQLKKTPTFLKPARAEQAVHKSFELVAELAETVDQLRFKVEALEGVGERMEAAAVDAEDIRRLGLDPELDALDPIDREALAKMKADDGQA